MTLPEPGDLNWGAPLNDAISATQADAAQAKSDASSARSTAIEARQIAVETKEFVEAPTSEQLDALLPDKIVDTEGPVGAAVDSVAQARADAAEQAAKDASIPTTEKAAPDGVAPLDTDSRVPQVNLPEHLTPTALSASTAEGIADDGYDPGMTPREAAELRTLRTVPNPLRRSVLMELPFKFPGYATVVAAKGYTYMWPQAMQYHGDRLFILYGATTGSTASGAWVSVHDATTGAYVSGFSTDADSYGEGLVIRDEAGVTNLYTRKTSGIVGRYDITTMPADQATLAAAQTYSVDLFSAVIDDGNGGFLVQRYANGAGASYPRNRFRRYDATLSTPGAEVVFDPVDFWSITADLIPLNLKAQSITRYGSGYAVGYGSAYFPGDTPTAANYCGIKIFDSAARPVASGVCNPDGFIDTLVAAGHTVELIENEGLCWHNGTLYGLWVTTHYSEARAATGGILITRELVGDLDFTDAAENPPAATAVTSLNGFVDHDNNGARNPITGAAFTTLAQVIEFMRDAHLTRYALYTTGTSLTDINGAAIGSGSFLEITTGNYVSWVVTVTGSTGTTWHWVTGAEGALTQAKMVVQSGAAAPSSNGEAVVLGVGGTGKNHTRRAGTGAVTHHEYANDNGIVGFIQTFGSAMRYYFTSDRFISGGTGSPEGVVTANPGSMWLRTDGGAGTTFYVKETGTGSTGWVAK